jgi:DNA-binding response OmpR family regulator
MKILIVEDDSTMRSLLKTLLELENFSVDAYEKDNAQEILDIISSTVPDVVLMDVNLRFANGLDIASKIRAKQSMKQPKIILSSGMDYKKECEKNSVDLFLLKPYMPDDLIKWLHAI